MLFDQQCKTQIYSDYHEMQQRKASYLGNQNYLRFCLKDGSISSVFNSFVYSCFCNELTSLKGSSHFLLSTAQNMVHSEPEPILDLIYKEETELVPGVFLNPYLAIKQIWIADNLPLQENYPQQSKPSSWGMFWPLWPFLTLSVGLSHDNISSMYNCQYSYTLSRYSYLAKLYTWGCTEAKQ